MLCENYSIRGQARYTLNKICHDWELSKAAGDATPVFISTMKDKNTTVEERKWAIEALRMIGPLLKRPYLNLSASCKKSVLQHSSVPR